MPQKVLYDHWLPQKKPNIKGNAAYFAMKNMNDH